MPVVITSAHNPRVKEAIKLAKRGPRDARRLTMVEGLREVTQALHSGSVPVEAFVCPSLLPPGSAPVVERLAALEQARATQVVEVTPEVFAKLAYRGDSGGLLLVVPYLARCLEELPLGSTPFVAVIEGVEKPGNLGAILRTADAAGVDGVIVCGGATDIHNPNTVRASLGMLFSVPVAEGDSQAALRWLREHGIAVIAAVPGAPVRYTDADMTGPVAIALGSEAHGLSPAWLAAAQVQVQIPMFGLTDSLNLATSAALLLYEVVRQRGR